MRLVNKIYSGLFGNKHVVKPNFDDYVFDANSKYDLQTFHIIKSLLQKDSNSIDIGAHKGEVLRKLIGAAPSGRHFAFEPIPELFQSLEKEFGNSASIFPYALGERNARATFNLVTTNPAYSGLLKRHYDRPEQDQLIEVEVRMLDELIPADVPIHLLKIDVEGAEFGVIKGAVELLKKWKPVIIYEQGLGASEIYGTDPKVFYEFLAGLGYSISLMEYYLSGKEPLGQEEYCHQFWKRYNYYFIAYQEVQN